MYSVVALEHAELGVSDCAVWARPSEETSEPTELVMPSGSQLSTSRHASAILTDSKIHHECLAISTGRRVETSHPPRTD